MNPQITVTMQYIIELDKDELDIACLANKKYCTQLKKKAREDLELLAYDDVERFLEKLLPTAVPVTIDYIVPAQDGGYRDSQRL